MNKHMNKKIQLYLTSVDAEQKDDFKNKFIKGVENSSNFEHVWSFLPSEKNTIILEKIKKNDWILFSFNGRYSYAGIVSKKAKSKVIARKFFGIKKQDQNLIIFCNKIFEIKKGIQKTNLEMGIKTGMSNIHKINLVQSKDGNLKNLIKKFGTIEKYLEIKQRDSIKKEIEKIVPSSMKKEPQKIKTTSLRRVRDTVKSKKLKKIYENKCQICNYSFPDTVKTGYSEVHHVWPMGDEGDDDFENMLVLCPNHHTEFDYRIIQFDSKNHNKITDLRGEQIGTISFKKGHLIAKKNISFHNSEVRRTFFDS